jgi:hypothetical protein
MNEEQIRSEWSTIIITDGRGKAHLNPECRYIRHKDTQTKPISKYPPGHLDYCQACLGYYQNWRDGLSASEGECARCGRKETHQKYCGDCQDHIDKMESR